ncbi:Zn(II)2Cys6 transcription factor domain-containing protein [Aspergillus ruber CBS 135680]|uniref:Zn(2)-C6 fungal-type domain-containing protein n=1 Tax=Aspergillus ruber (strain CBS 135680) TaxID=1388766 RepID=A0A017SNT1_ASPRC|nr:uncharacterized protein EURHEDRAFT_205763 [Aspergillus ruber CBS 135680]EYE98289.1 hypothetical protein EURHEDRAFT_205763 [Aspergillus ruber CBS 135680]
MKMKSPYGPTTLYMLAKISHYDLADDGVLTRVLSIPYTTVIFPPRVDLLRPVLRLQPIRHRSCGIHTRVACSDISPFPGRATTVDSLFSEASNSPSVFSALRRYGTRYPTSMNQQGECSTPIRSDAHTLHQQSASGKPGPTRRARKPRKCLSCEPCRHSKLRCDRQRPCGACQRRDCVSACSFHRFNGPLTPGVERTSRSPNQLQPTLQPAGGLITPHLVPSVQNINEDPVAPQGSLSGTQDSPSGHARWDAVLRRPTVDRNETSSALESLFVPSSVPPVISKEILLQQLPSDSFCEYLISEYFTHLSPLFHILHGPTTGE